MSASVDETDAPPPTSLTGNFRFHHDFPSRHLGNKRTLAIYLPHGYFGRRKLHYPVLYLQDGQNVFDARTAAFGVEWQADETAERLIKAGEIPPVIMVGIYNSADRIDEYTAHYDKKKKRGGRGSIYGRFVVEEVKPFIDKAYRTTGRRKDTGIVGSSLGGLAALHIASQFPDRIGMCAALSPSLWWCNEQQVKDLRRDSDWVRDMRLWVDAGTKETGNENENKAMARQVERVGEILEAAGLKPQVDFVAETIEGGEHTEGAWAARFDRVLRFLFA